MLFFIKRKEKKALKKEKKEGRMKKSGQNEEKEEKEGRNEERESKKRGKKAEREIFLGCLKKRKFNIKIVYYI